MSETQTELQVLAPEREARTFFVNLEAALSIDRLKSQRREAQAFYCIRDQVLVLPCEKEERTDSGLLYIPGAAQERQSEGIVIHAGQGRVDANNIFVRCEVQAGDRVLFGKYAGTEIILRGKTCRLMREDDILGVIR